MISSGIERDEVIGWGGPGVFNQALAIVNAGDVTEVEYDDEALEVRGRIEQPDGWEMPVRFKLEPGGRIHSLCPCITNQKYGQICPHVVALGLALTLKEDAAAEVEREKVKAKGEGEQGKDDSSTVQPPTSNLQPDFIEVPMAPAMSAYVAGSRASLSIEVDAHYGDRIEFPAGSPQADRTVYLEDPDDPLVRRTRSEKAERTALRSLEKWGFQPGYQTGDLKLYLTDPQKVLNFLGGGLPELRAHKWHVDLAPRLDALLGTMPSVLPVVKIRDAPNGAFDVSYDFEITYEKEGAEPTVRKISPVEIQAALNRGDSYILKDGAVALLDTHAVETMHDTFRDCATTQGGAADGWFRVAGVHAPFVKASLDILDDAVYLDDEAAGAWRELAKSRCGGEKAKYEPIALGALDKVLRPYQKQGVYWMRFLETAALGGLLADEMGLGKTLQTLAWLSLPRIAVDAESSPRPPVDAESFPRPPVDAESLRVTKDAITSSSDAVGHRVYGENRVHGKPSLIVCPTSLVRNWEAEAHKFTPWVKTLVISGPDRARDFPSIPSADLVITSYALLQRDFEDAYLDKTFSAVVLDEAQHIKNRETRNARAAKLLRAERRLVLTGTPVENSVADVWSIFDFLMPGYLGEYDDFKLGYRDPIDQGGEAGADAQARLKRKLAPFILRRLKKTVAKDLPDKLIKVSFCPIPADVRSDYNATLQKERGGAKTKFQMLALLMKLRQIASRGKVEAFRELLDEAIDGGHRVLVFSQFVKQLDVLREDLEKDGIPYCYLDGSTKDRLGECERFNRNREIPVFLISLMAGGTGLNLTGADMVIHYDPWWNPAVEDQATDRAHRIGQTKKVYVVKMIAEDTVEEKVLTLQRKKQAVIAATVSTSDEAIVEKLTTEDLAELLS